jgi:hypothetical protein
MPAEQRRQGRWLAMQLSMTDRAHSVRCRQASRNGLRIGHDHGRGKVLSPFPTPCATPTPALPELTAELRHVKRDPSVAFSGRLLERAAGRDRIPGTLPAMCAVMARSVAARQRVGTVAVTAVGMFAGGGGFGISPFP